MIRKHSITLHGHRTSFSLEEPFLDELRRLADERGQSLAALIADVDAGRGTSANLSSALRLHVLTSLKATAAEAMPEQAVLEQAASEREPALVLAEVSNSHPADPQSD